MINLDPALLDQDKIRKKRRKMLLKRYAIPIALLVLISLFFLSTWIYNLFYLICYNGKHFPIADSYTETRFVINVLEPYIADYDQGVARLKMGEYGRAEKSFTESLQKSPADDRLCQIYVNLSLSIELQADASLQKSDYNKALELYNKAENVLYNTGCAKQGSDSSGKDSKAEAAKERLINKRSDATDSMNNTQSVDEDANATPQKKQITEEELRGINMEIVSPNEVRGGLNGENNRQGDHCMSYLKKCW